MPTAVSTPVGVGVRVEPRDDVALAADIAISAGDPPASRRRPVIVPPPRAPPPTGPGPDRTGSAR